MQDTVQKLRYHLCRTISQYFRKNAKTQKRVNPKVVGGSPAHSHTSKKRKKTPRTCKIILCSCSPVHHFGWRAIDQKTKITSLKTYKLKKTHQRCQLNLAKSLPTESVAEICGNQWPIQKSKISDSRGTKSKRLIP